MSNVLKNKTPLESKTEEELYSELKKIWKKQASLCKKADRLKKEIAKKCSHLMVREYVWEHDTGYGVQRKYTGKWCVLCDKKDPYGHL